MKFLRILFFPFGSLYYLITQLRNLSYDLGWQSSQSYDFPVICVGNLSVGGTGKTPTVEYLVRLFQDQYKLAILSRGYKRKSKGFVLGDENANVETLGDEPFQFFRKFKKIKVAVDANRRNGIVKLVELVSPDIILLDDAFQHRKVKAGFNILLTSYHQPYFDDFLLPAGNLRESRAGAKRAEVIIVTKCPRDISEAEKQEIIKKIKPREHQKVFFSTITYSEKIYNSKGEESTISQMKDSEFTLVTGIANPKPLVAYLRKKNLKFKHLYYPDHHNFSDAELAKLKSQGLIVTTEKDFVRLEGHFKNESQLYYLPIQFELDQPDDFKAAINDFLERF